MKLETIQTVTHCINPLRTVVHRPNSSKLHTKAPAKGVGKHWVRIPHFFWGISPQRCIKLQHKAPSKGVKKHCFLLSLGRDNRRQRAKRATQLTLCGRWDTVRGASSSNTKLHQRVGKIIVSCCPWAGTTVGSSRLHAKLVKVTRKIVCLQMAPGGRFVGKGLSCSNSRAKSQWRKALDDPFFAIRPFRLILLFDRLVENNCCDSFFSNSLSKGD
jgi:hypothetical protein